MSDSTVGDRANAGGDDPTGSTEIPVFQRLYNRIWLIALLGTAFFAVSYLGWGLIDVLSAPVR